MCSEIMLINRRFEAFNCSPPGGGFITTFIVDGTPDTEYTGKISQIIQRNIKTQ